MKVKAAVSIILVLAHFLSVLQLAIPAYLAMSPHEGAAVITRLKSKQEDPARCALMSRQD